jgi:hypothetical protein
MIVSFTWQHELKFHIDDLRLLACIGLEHVFLFLLLFFLSFLIWSAATFLFFFVKRYFNLFFLF